MTLKFYTPPVTGGPNGTTVYFDWLGRDNTDFLSCTNLDEVLTQPVRVACLPFIPCAGDLPDLDYSQFDLVLISDIESNKIGRAHV